MGASTGGPGAWQVSTNLETVVTNYLRARTAALGTREAYSATVKKWEQWGQAAALEQIGRKEIREFLDWVHERAVAQGGSNPGRTANKAREHLRAVMAWAWEQDLLDALPGFPKPRQHRAVAGRHYLTKEEINALYFATHRMKRPKSWDGPYPEQSKCRVLMRKALQEYGMYLGDGAGGFAVYAEVFPGRKNRWEGILDNFDLFNIPTEKLRVLKLPELHSEGIPLDWPTDKFLKQNPGFFSRYN